MTGGNQCGDTINEPNSSPQPQLEPKCQKHLQIVLNLIGKLSLEIDEQVNLLLLLKSFPSVQKLVLPRENNDEKARNTKSLYIRMICYNAQLNPFTTVEMKSIPPVDKIILL